MRSGSDPFVTNHLDEILDDYTPSDGIDTPHKAFASLIEALADIGTSNMAGRLVIPLGWSADVVTDPLGTASDQS